MDSLFGLQEEDRNEDISIALRIQEQFSTSALFKDILEAISLILHYRDNVLIGIGIFPYIYHVGCTFNLFSIINNGLVPGGQNLSRRQTVFFLPVDPRNEDHKDPEYIDYSCTHVEHDTCKMHGRDIKIRYFGSILILESEKDQCSFRQDRTQLFSRNTSSPLYCKS